MKIRLIHLKALVVLGMYYAFANVVVVQAIRTGNTSLSYVIPFIYGTLASLVFLYIFSHEDFFRFARDIKKSKMKTERKYLRKFRHLGKSMAVVVIGLIGGPVFGALSARLLFTRGFYPYALLIVTSIPSTILTVSIYTGAIKLII